MKHRKNLLSAIAKALGVLCFWGGVWCLLTFLIQNDFLFPSPIAVGKELVRLSLTGSFWLTAAISLLRVVAGILISLILGTLLGTLTSLSKLCDALLRPVITAVKATPVASFIILALLWFDRTLLPVFITALIVVPIVWANVTEGIASVDEGLREVAKVYRFSAWKKLRRLYVPTVAPYFLAACRSSLGMAWKAGIAAEILATPNHAIGTELYYSKTYLETPTLFAWTLVVIVLSLVIEKLFLFALQKLGRKFRVLPKGDSYAAS